MGKVFEQQEKISILEQQIADARTAVDRIINLQTDVKNLISELENEMSPINLANASVYETCALCAKLYSLQLAQERYSRSRQALLEDIKVYQKKLSHAKGVLKAIEINESSADDRRLRAEYVKKRTVRQ